MRRFFTTESTEGREKPSVKLGCSCGSALPVGFLLYL